MDTYFTLFYAFKSPTIIFIVSLKLFQQAPKLFVSVSLISSTTRCSSLILCFLCLKPWNQLLQKTPASFHGRIGCKNYCRCGFTVRPTAGTATTSICFLTKIIGWKSWASLGSWLEIQVLGPHPRPTIPESLKLWCRSLRFSRFTGLPDDLRNTFNEEKLVFLHYKPYFHFTMCIPHKKWGKLVFMTWL